MNYEVYFEGEMFGFTKLTNKKEKNKSKPYNFITNLPMISSNFLFYRIFDFLKRI
jgi:hypothetical protein